jgi:polar amino acid transport system substrate-binding protein
MNFQLSKKFISLTVGLLLLIIFSAGCGNDESTEQSSATRPKLIIATDTTLVPMSFIGEEGTLIGFEPDLIAELSKVAGFDYEMISVAWPGLFGGLITQKFDMVISSVTILEERKKRMAFSTPYLKSGLALVVRKDSQGVESLADVKAKNLLAGAQVGTTAYFYLEKHPTLRKKGYEAYGHAITDLINGELDAVLGESTGTLYYKNQREEYFKQIKMVGEIITEEYYGIVLHKKDTELLNKINSAIDQLLRNGTIAKLHAKWNLGKAAQLP